MSSSLFSGVSGLTSFQKWMDVIGNNIANAATPGFKTSVVVFADILNQTLSAGAAPSGNRGGINPMQLGLGVTVGSITPVFLQGALQTTNRNTDLAIQGDGFFMVSDGTGLFFTRAGAFNLDANGDLVESVTGFKVQGANGDIRIGLGQQGAAALTTTAQLKGNLDFLAPDGTAVPLTFTFVDSVGATHNLTVTFTKNFAAAPGQWDWAATSTDAGILNITTGTGSIVFDENGGIASGDTQDIGVEFVPSSGVTSPQPITLDFGTAANNTPLTGFASASSVALSNQDGLVSGTLTSFAVGADGSIIGFFSNGTAETLDQVLLATFNNPGGLLKVGQNHFRQTAVSGVANIGVPGVGGRGILTPGNLEASNVDLATEFTSMILAQTGFSANARTISVSNEMLQTVINISR
jgi:flagellar hook protein FlgE